MSNKRVVLENLGYEKTPAIGSRDRAEYSARWGRYRNYGLLPEQYAALCDKQGSKCYLCGCKRPLLVDHDHIRNVIRGLLCRSCNSMLGWYERRRERIEFYVHRTAATIHVEIQ